MTMKILFITLFALGVLQLFLFTNQYIARPIRQRHLYRLPFLSQTNRTHLRLGRPRLLQKLDHVIGTSGIRISSDALIMFSMVFSLPGFFAAYYIFANPFMGMLFGMISGSLPIILLVFNFHHRQRYMNSLILPMLQIFLGVYSNYPNIRQCLHHCIPLLPLYMKQNFLMITNSINTGKPLNEALYDFAGCLNNPFADDFVDLLTIADETGEDIRQPIMNLMNRVQDHKFNNEMERTELIDIRYGTMVIIAVTVFLVWYNIRLGQGPFQSSNPILDYYTKTASGQSVLGTVTVIQFISLLGSFWIGRKKA